LPYATTPFVSRAVFTHGKPPCEHLARATLSQISRATRFSGVPPGTYRVQTQRIGYGLSEVTVEDTWFTAGMRASGSNCIIAKEVFVPNHRLMNILEAIEGKYPTEYKDESAYRAAFMPVSALILVGPQLGMGRAALKYVIEKASHRAIAYTSFERQIDSTAFQMQIAEASLKIDTAHLRAFRAADEVDLAAVQNRQLEFLTRARMRADTGLVVTYVTDAINTLISAHGAGSFAESSPMQRIWRDSNTAARHAIALPSVANEIYGKALLGIPNTVSPLV